MSDRTFTPVPNLKTLHPEAEPEGRTSIYQQDGIALLTVEEESKTARIALDKTDLQILISHLQATHDEMN